MLHFHFINHDPTPAERMRRQSHRFWKGKNINEINERGNSSKILKVMWCQQCLDGIEIYIFFEDNENEHSDYCILSESEEKEMHFFL